VRAKRPTGCLDAMAVYMPQTGLPQGPISGLGNLRRSQPPQAAGGVLRSPRPVPPLGLDNMVVVKKPSATNDEVASILKGLQLDRKFFVSRLDQSLLESLAPAAPDKRQSGNGDGEEDGVTCRRLQRMKSKVLKRVTARAAAAAQQPKKVADFDIYMGEALMPVLAQALDSLSRQVNRMQAQGDSLDPKVRARFNPLTFLAQQLLRRHPKCSKTPRRQVIYSNFRDWSDLERGRRELLRRKDLVKEVFDGFVLRGVCQRDHIPEVVSAIDATLGLGGTLTKNQDLHSALQTVPMGLMRTKSERSQASRSDFFTDSAWTFQEFWYHFANAIMSMDVVRFSSIQSGIEAAQREALMRSEQEFAKKREEEERKAREEKDRQDMQAYTALHLQMQTDEHITSILNDGKILTGDDVRPGDIGFELEVPPRGDHVVYLAELLRLIGFVNVKAEVPESRIATKDEPGGYPQLAGPPKEGSAPPVAKPEGEAAKAHGRWWDDELASAWSTIQEIHRADITDGVVEREMLEKVMVQPVGFIMLKNKMIDELDRRAADGDQLFVGSRRPSQVETVVLGKGLSNKPSIETLCQRLGITMARMEWLHRLFESFLEPDPDKPGVVPCCLYPECPAAIKKDQMRQLIMEVRPDMEDQEFESRFRRIDVDQSGMVEFDEFVTWVREDEVRVAGAAPSQKMSFVELAQVYDEDIQLIHYLHRCFQDRFDDDDVDDYPKRPVGLEKTKVRALVSSLTPSMTDGEFETHFQMVTFQKKDNLDFDEFLEVLPFDQLPVEILTAEEPPPEG